MNATTSAPDPGPPHFVFRKTVGQPTVPLGQNLVNAGILSEGDLEAALKQHSSSNSQLGETLLEMGFVDEDTLLIFLGQQMGVPAVRLRSGIVDPAVVRTIPRAKAESFTALALFSVRGQLTVAMRNHPICAKSTNSNESPDLLSSLCWPCALPSIACSRFATKKTSQSMPSLLTSIKTPWRFMPTQSISR